MPGIGISGERRVLPPRRRASEATEAATRFADVRHVADVDRGSDHRHRQYPLPMPMSTAAWTSRHNLRKATKRPFQKKDRALEPKLPCRRQAGVDIRGSSRTLRSPFPAETPPVRRVPATHRHRLRRKRRVPATPETADRPVRRVPRPHRHRFRPGRRQSVVRGAVPWPIERQERRETAVPWPIERQEGSPTDVPPAIERHLGRREAVPRRIQRQDGRAGDADRRIERQDGRAGDADRWIDRLEKRRGDAVRA